jgi:hypothetical protein
MTRSWLFRIGVVLVAIGVLGGIAAGIARGFDDDHRTIEYRVVERGGEAANDDGPTIVVERDRDFPRGAFFPVFPLVVFGGVLIVASIFATRHDGPPGWRRGWEEWHREAHRHGAPNDAEQG